MKPGINVCRGDRIEFIFIASLSAIHGYTERQRPIRKSKPLDIQVINWSLFIVTINGIVSICVLTGRVEKQLCPGLVLNTAMGVQSV